MIVSNPEHKKAKLKKIIKSGKIVLSVSLSGVLITLSVFVYTNIIKYNNIEFTDDLGKTRNTYSRTINLLFKELEKDYKDNIVKSYKENLKKENKSDIKQDVEHSFEIAKNDSDIVSISDEYKQCILKSLHRDDEYKNNPNIKITVEDLKKITQLNESYFFTELKVSSNSDLSWLNYCENLCSVEFCIKSKDALENLKQIKNLKNLEKLLIDIDTRNVEDFRIPLTKENFPFLENNNITFLYINPNYVNSDTPLCEKIGENSDYTYLELMNYTSTSKKVNVETLKKWSRVTFKMRYGTGTYDFASIYTREELIELIKSGIEIEIFDSEDNRLEAPVFFKEVFEIHNAIDKIVKSLKFNDSMSDNEKLNIVLEYTLKTLNYSENAAKIQREEGYETNIFGFQSQKLVKEVTENSYKNGYLYGAIDQNGKPVCGSYAELMQVLLERVGVKSYRVNSKYHAYNLVNVNGEYYYVDATYLDKPVIDIDEITKNNQHLINPYFTNDIYKTTVMPEEVPLPDINVEARVQEIIDNVKKDYLIKFNNQLYNVSFTVLITILSMLGLAHFDKKLKEMEKEEGDFYKPNSFKR